MKHRDRQRASIDLPTTGDEPILDDLDTRFDVSPMTIHRDHSNLERAEVLRKNRGGATAFGLIDPSTTGMSNHTRGRHHRCGHRHTLAKIGRMFFYLC